MLRVDVDGDDDTFCIYVNTTYFFLSIFIVMIMIIIINAHKFAQIYGVKEGKKLEIKKKSTTTVRKMAQANTFVIHIYEVVKQPTNDQVVDDKNVHTTNRTEIRRKKNK